MYLIESKIPHYTNAARAANQNLTARRGANFEICGAAFADFPNG